MTGAGPEISRIVRKLQNFTRLAADDCSALAALQQKQLQTAQPRRDLVREGDEPANVRLVVSAWACRYKGLPDGRRQIVSFLIPRDFYERRRLRIPDLTRLMNAAMFNPSYLHLGHEGRYLDANA